MSLRPMPPFVNHRDELLMLPPGVLGGFIGICFALMLGLMQIAHVRAAQSACLSLCCFGVLTIIARHFRRSLQLLPQCITPPLAAWTLLSSLSCLWSFEPGTSFALVMQDVWLPSVCFVGASLLARNEQFLKWSAVGLSFGWVWLCVAVFSAVVLGRFDFLQSGGGEGASTHMLMRWYPGPGLASTFIVMALPMVWWMKSRSLIPPWLAWGLLLGLIISGTASFNRMFWPCLAVMGLICMLVNLAFRARRFSNGIIASVFIAVVLMSISIPLISTAIRSHFDFNRQGFSQSVDVLAKDPRLIIWRNWIAAGQQRPLLGTGFGKPVARHANASQFSRYTPEQMDPAGRTHPHNLFLSLWVQTGIFGVLVFIVALGAVARAGMHMVRNQAWRTRGCMLLALVGAFVCKNTTDDFYDKIVIVIFWSYVGLMIGAKPLLVGAGSK